MKITFACFFFTSLVIKFVYIVRSVSNVSKYMYYILSLWKLEKLF